MAKTKTKHTNKNKHNNKIENDIMVYIYALTLITFSIIGGSQFGPVGEILTNLLKYVFGNLYGLVYLMLIAFGILLLMKKNIASVPNRIKASFVILFFAWLLAAALPANEAIKGLEIFTAYLRDSALILQGQLESHGGIIGALLVSIFTFLIDYGGTRIVIGALLILGVILLFNGQLLNYCKKFFSGVKKILVAIFKDPDSKKGKVETPAVEESDEEEIEPAIFDDSIEERIKHGQVTFQDIDANFDVDDLLGNGEVISANEIAHPKADIGDIEINEVGSAFSEDYRNYKLPKLNLLNDIVKKAKSSNNVTAANDCGRRLIQILDEFGVKATLIATHIGPAVTKFEIKPDLGVRVNKISNLQHDIKMALAAKDIRIEAPIPGKSAVGIEIPNMEKTSVSLKELMQNIPSEYDDKKLLFALGKDLLGNNVYGELNKMPHLLIAGATGSGKSVCVNTIISSLIMRCKPDEVKLLLIDPKKVEFTPFHNIPHLIGPVITDGEEANRALKVIVQMMEERYELFSTCGVRNIAGYNSYIETHTEEQLHTLPFVVVIIDELADLMIISAKEVESSIQRITQLARAAGIHLVVATQRPSVDVVTGVIKANIPSRIAFSVSSAVDSRTILDHMGAERLLGFGDMLYIPVGETSPTRVQGGFVSDGEVQLLCDFISKQAKPKFNDAFLRLEVVDKGGSVGSENADPLFEEVKQFVIESRRASTSFIQRKFSIGYARAARLMDCLEADGYIGPSNGSKPREILVNAPLAIDEDVLVD